MTRSLTLAAAQLGPIHRADSRASAVRRLIDLLEEAHGRGARLVVFPELALTTFFPRWWMTDQAEIDAYFEREMPGPETKPLFDRAAELGIGFYLGYAELTQEAGRMHRYNTSILVDPTGKLIGKYRKIHLPGHAEHLPEAPFQHLEKRYFEVGNGGFKVWRAMGANLGMCICNDRRWPETFRVMGLQDVEIVVLGYNTPTDNIHHPEPVHLRMFHHLVTMQANAYQNGTWVVASAKAGREDGYGMIGGSAIIAPTGEIAAQALTEEDEVIAVKADLELGAYIKRTVFNFAKHRRIEHYRLITERVAAEPPTATPEEF
ncbi:MAG TPA: N-carbamoyl-D-amino-acid hydrolase [Stellaceae bacterium]|nr:N-carbamoyl-D-amino-acid hydrolase [Stellaceae bacterium]